MIDQAIKSSQQSKVEKIEAEIKRLEKMIPAWAHQYIRVTMDDFGFRREISYPRACMIAIEVYRPIWFPLVKRVRYIVADPNPFSVFMFHRAIRRTDDLREAIAVAVIKKDEFDSEMARIRWKRSENENK